MWGFFLCAEENFAFFKADSADFEKNDCYFSKKKVNLEQGVDLMNTHLSIRIQDQMPHFSKGQRLIAKYIEEHYDKVAFMTASKLGSTVGVSESTVVRFATELGYDGYPELDLPAPLHPVNEAVRYLALIVLNR